MTDNIKTMAAICTKLRLEHSGGNLSLALLREAYNGAGPEWASSYMRNIGNFILRTFLPAVMLHDFEYHISDGNVLTFHKANKMFYNNCLKLAKSKYPWYLYPIRLIAYSKAYLAFIAVEEHGFEAYIDGFNNIKHRI